ncbi:MAG: N4-gp56 family major capsid protein [Gallionella sp.]|jgi:N4-gp56 family major capsid protein
MGIQAYGLSAGRVNEILGETLAYAEPTMVLSLGCEMKQIPKNKGDNISYRRIIPTGGATTNANTINRWSVTAVAHLLQEGVTPAAETLTDQYVNVQLNQYGAIYGWTNKTADLHEDDIPKDMSRIMGKRMGLVQEMIRYGAMKACTNVYYSGGTSRATVVSALSLNVLRRAARGLMANHAEKKSRIIRPGPEYDTSAIEEAFLVMVHTDAAADVRELPGFVPVAKYAGMQVLSPKEIGSCEEFRFVLSPELAAYADAGGANSALYATTSAAANVDVYPFIVCGEEAVYDIALKGEDSFDMNVIPHTQRDKGDILGQRGYCGASFWSAALVVNNGRMAVIEAGVSSLT